MSDRDTSRSDYSGSRSGFETSRSELRRSQTGSSSWGEDFSDVDDDDLSLSDDESASRSRSLSRSSSHRSNSEGVKRRQSMRSNKDKKKITRATWTLIHNVPWEDLSGEDKTKLKTFANWSPLRVFAHDLTEHRFFSSFILIIIFLNTALLTAQIDQSSARAAGWYFSFVDALFLSIYTWELLLKLYTWRAEFWNKGWNVFDFIIVLLSMLDVLWMLIFSSVASFNPRIFRLLRVFRAVRAIRALRVLRTISFLKHLQMIVNTMLKSIPAWGSITLLTFLILYIFALIGVSLYASVDPQRWGNIWRSMFSLFVLITLDNWSNMYEDVRDKTQTIFIFLLVYIIVVSFILINLFVAVIVNNLSQLQRRNTSNTEQHKPKADVRPEKQQRLAKAASFHQREVERSLHSKHPLALAGQDIHQYYANLVTDPRTKQHMGHCFMLLAALESNLEWFHNQQKTLDDLVDVLPRDPKTS